MGHYAGAKNMFTPLNIAAKTFEFINSYSHSYEMGPPPFPVHPSPMWKDVVLVAPATRPSHMGHFSKIPVEIRLMIYDIIFRIPHAGYGTNVAHIKELKEYLGILGTCRAIYWEARQIPFHLNVFNFCRSDHIREDIYSLDWIDDACLAFKFIRSLRPWQASALAGVITNFLSMGLRICLHRKQTEILSLDNLIPHDSYVIRAKSMLTRIVRTIGPIDAYNTQGEKVATVLVGERAWMDLLSVVNEQVWFLRKPKLAKEIQSIRLASQASV